MSEEVLEEQEERAHQPAELRMGEDIARNLTHAGDDLPEEIATHIRKFWDPRMRRAILRAYEEGAEMSDGLRAGVEAYRQGEIDRGELREPSGG